VLFYDAIRKYVSSYVNIYYGDEKALAGDFELQNWRREIVLPVAQGGAGINGIPGDDQQGFTSPDELIDTLSAIIAIATVGHNSAHDLVHDEYMYAPNYPSNLLGVPPTCKDPITERDIMSHFRNKSAMIDGPISVYIQMGINATNSVGNYETEYIYDPPAMAVLEQFRSDLESVHIQIESRNKNERCVPYKALDPVEVHNSAAI